MQLKASECILFCCVLDRLKSAVFCCILLQSAPHFLRDNNDLFSHFSPFIDYMEDSKKVLCQQLSVQIFPKD